MAGRDEQSQCHKQSFSFPRRILAVIPFLIFILLSFPFFDKIPAHLLRVYFFLCTLRSVFSAVRLFWLFPCPERSFAVFWPKPFPLDPLFLLTVFLPSPAIFLGRTRHFGPNPIRSSRCVRRSASQTRLIVLRIPVLNQRTLHRLLMRRFPARKPDPSSAGQDRYSTYRWKVWKASDRSPVPAQDKSHIADVLGKLHRILQVTPRMGRHKNTEVRTCCFPVFLLHASKRRINS